ncbi:MAG: aldo/keto reductase [candidate division Zixibacteria bacterium]|nr:aldo/keto reductase [candidate division Zixibacteria bacterium]MCI0597352.1 aldo/keto reductase [candidate division Zixibacteria bacterium]
MKKRKLGNSGLEIAPLVFGGNVFGWTADEPASFKLLDGFVDAGFNCIDTAEGYSNWHPGNKGGESETIIGKWLKKSGKRDRVIIATKVGWWNTPEDNTGLTKARILQAAEDSLKRLQTDYIDLYQTHKDDPNNPIEERLEAYVQLLAQGKIRAIGASNYTAPRLAEALRISSGKHLPRYESLQPLYNLYSRSEFEAELQPLCLKENTGVITYSSLASGFLSGKYRSTDDLSKSLRGYRVKKYLNDRGFRILSAVEKVANEHDSTPATVALAWLLTRPAVSAPIASATSLAQLDELTAGARLKLNADSTELLNKASA